MINDFFTMKCNKVVPNFAPDGFGGYKTVHLGLNDKFYGVVVVKSKTPVTIGANPDKEIAEFNFFCNANVPLAKDDIIQYEDLDKTVRYVKITTTATLPAPMAIQGDWKVYEAEKFEPFFEVENE